MHSGGARKCAQRPQPAQSEFVWGPAAGWFVRSPIKALFCRRRRRASGAFEGLSALKPVFDSPYACAVRQLGPRERKERQSIPRGRAGNQFASRCDARAAAQAAARLPSALGGVRMLLLRAARGALPPRVRAACVPGRARLSGARRALCAGASEAQLAARAAVVARVFAGQAPPVEASRLLRAAAGHFAARGLTRDATIALTAFCRDEACAPLRALVERHYGPSFHAHSLGGAITLGKVRARGVPRRLPRGEASGAAAGEFRRCAVALRCAARAVRCGEPEPARATGWRPMPRGEGYSAASCVESARRASQDAFLGRSRRSLMTS